MELSDYIKVFDNVVPEAICKNLISTYENSNPEFVNNEGRPKFHHLSLDPEMSKFLLENLRKCLSDYALSTELTKWMPGKYAVEDFRIKKYRKGTDDRFSTHVDVGDHASARRFLAFFIYLNTIEEGGETAFPGIKTVKPKCGRVLMFPPLWTFPHEGRPTISDHKYIVGSYLHYI